MHFFGNLKQHCSSDFRLFERAKKQVKIYNQKSVVLNLIGGGPQGSIIHQLLYIIASNDVIEDVTKEDKFKYIDDL